MLHMEQVNLKKYRVTTVKEAQEVLEEAGDALVCSTPPALMTPSPRLSADS